MAGNLERRENARIDHTSPLKIKDRKSGKIYKARLLNYSKNGLYFETDSMLNPGDQIYTGIQDSPYAASSGVFEYFKCEIRWRKKLKHSIFDYGYGIKLLADLNQKTSKKPDAASPVDTVRKKKRPIRKTIKISDQSGTYQGLIKDISPSGVFFETNNTFEEGQILTFSLPLPNGNESKVKGQIVWGDKDGFGVIFLNQP